ncbi:hypothetical protein DFH08DRAFT_462601 [Mycena albidolilacea]|uniref:Uncharacterized protein n=1 Tax=Mycena albidolilacea TaxID=1033008 RepID=A0AAD7AEH6_9AGAR|nr:hypothetical protein DFH08DRAFT_462601 [Mycena albidolilacea]
MAAQLACPSVDKEGNDLIGNASTGPDFNCFYFSDEICLYDAAGELETGASEGSCPSQMVAPGSAGNHSQSSTPTSGTTSSSSQSMSSSSTLITSKGVATQSPTSSSSLLISSPPIPGDSPIATNPVASPTLSVAANLSNRNGGRTAAIAGSLAAVCVLIGIVVLIFWIRRRRKLREQARLPEQFVEAQERVLQDNLRLKAGIARPANNLQRADPANDPENGEGDEPMIMRMRRMEAQLQAILTMALPEGSPPSYTG